jgi:2-oxoglutarate/2-oxoacid ferredoxin oxidoreductase subunit beta
VLERAIAHKGISFVEIYQNCIIFNDKTFGPVTGRDNRAERMIYLEDGKPLIFGAEQKKGIRLNGLQPEVVRLEDVKNENELLIHRENQPDPSYAYLLTQMAYPEMPEPFGVFRSIERPTYNFMMNEQVKHAIEKRGAGDLKNLIYGNSYWKVA